MARYLVNCPQLSFAEIAALGQVGLIICANHAIRAAVAAVRATFSCILGEGGIAGVEGTIATIAEIFTLQGDERMRELVRGSCVEAPRLPGRQPLGCPRGP